MENFRATAPRWHSPILHLTILVPAGLLVFYHLTMSADIVMGRGLSANASYNATQLLLRLAIVASLAWVALGKRWAVWAMWASITGLVATQYLAHFGWVEAEFTVGRQALSYLKGFLFPSIISLAFFLRARTTANPPS